MKRSTLIKSLGIRTRSIPQFYFFYSDENLSFFNLFNELMGIKSNYKMYKMKPKNFCQVDFPFFEKRLSIKLSPSYISTEKLPSIMRTLIHVDQCVFHYSLSPPTVSFSTLPTIARCSSFGNSILSL